MNSYSKSELILLKYANGFNIKNTFPNYFSTLHHLDVPETVEKLISDGLLSIAPVSYSISQCTISALKAFLANKNVKAKGNKAEIVQYIIEHYETAELETFFPERYYVLTENGHQLLGSCLAVEEYTDRFEPILTGFSDAYVLIKAKKYQAAQQCLEKFGHNCVTNHSDNKVYDDFFKYGISFPKEMSEIDYKTYIILYYMYGLRSESVYKDFKKRTGIDIPRSQLHKHLRIVQSIDEVISRSHISLKSNFSSLRCRYTIKALNDEHVCEHCKSLNGHSFEYKDAVIGITYPPFNECKSEFCRCLALFELVEKVETSENHESIETLDRSKKNTSSGIIQRLKTLITKSK